MIVCPCHGLTRHISIALMLLWMTGCAVGPDYQRPAITLPAQYASHQEWQLSQPADRTARDGWWQTFADSTLNDLESKALQANQSLVAALAQYRAARAQVEVVRAGSLPTLGGQAAETRGKPAGIPTVASTHSLGVQASWEPDLWGSISRAVEQQRDLADASAANVESVRLSIQAEVAEEYFALRFSDLQQDLQSRTVEAYTRSLQLTRNQYAAGIVSAADVAQAETQLSNAQTQLTATQWQRLQIAHALATLTGQAATAFHLAAELQLPVVPRVPEGVPSQLLERRPDIAAAERNTMAANAAIGMAKAAWFPTMTLSAQAGYQSSHFGPWLEAPNNFWSLGPTLAATLFDGGKRRAGEKAAQSGYDAAVATYRQVVLQALQEVEDDLVQLNGLSHELISQQHAVQSSQRALDVVSNQYKAGITSYLNVLTAQTAAYTAQSNQLNLLSQQTTTTILLIRALGGGWGG